MILMMMMMMMTIHCQLEGDRAKERTGHRPSYAEAKKMKSALHLLGFIQAIVVSESTSFKFIAEEQFFSEAMFKPGSSTTSHVKYFEVCQRRLPWKSDGS